MENAVVAPTPLVPAAPGFGARLAALPAKTKLAGGVGIAAIAAVVVALALAMNQGEYRVLFANLTDRDGGPIIEKLSQLNVPYRFAEGGGAILVPAAQVYELRLKLSAAGLPKGSVNGYELLDKSPFGQTQGQERIAVQRALEGELTRTIQSLDSVQSARVHLALPNQNGFFREQQKPSASVVLNLYPGRTLDRAQLAGIVHLVSASVPELDPKSVSIIDGTGALLSGSEGARGDEGLDKQQLEYVRDIERAYRQRVVELLEPVVGRDNLRASVTAEVDFSQTEQTSEEFRPNQGNEPAAVRAARITEAGGAGSAVPAGVPGATSNQPPVPASAPISGPAQTLQGAQPGAAGGSTRREAETRYEVDKTVRVTRNAVGSIRRLHAAVVVNHRSTTDRKGKTTTVPLPADELAKLTTLVEQGIGMNKERGDSVSVVDAPFRAEAEPAPAELPLWQQPWLQELVHAWAAPGSLLLVGLVATFALVRPALKAATAPPAPPPATALDEVVGDAEPAEAAAAPPALAAPRAGDKLEAARRLARENPAAVASIVRGWVSGEAGA